MAELKHFILVELTEDTDERRDPSASVVAPVRRAIHATAEERGIKYSTFVFRDDQKTTAFNFGVNPFTELESIVSRIREGAKRLKRRRDAEYPPCSECGRNVGMPANLPRGHVPHKRSCSQWEPVRRSS